jgi:hypothetical protein
MTSGKFILSSSREGTELIWCEAMEHYKNRGFLVLLAKHTGTLFLEHKLGIVIYLALDNHKRYI